MTPTYFTCMASPMSGNEGRWITHDHNKNGAGEFDSEQEARSCVDNWNTKGGELFTMDWTAPNKEAEDSDRGTYIIGLKGTNFRMVIRCGWSSSESASERIKLLRNCLVKYGFDAMSQILFAAQDKLTEYGWTCVPKKS